MMQYLQYPLLYPSTTDTNFRDLCCHHTFNIYYTESSLTKTVSSQHTFYHWTTYCRADGIVAALRPMMQPALPGHKKNSVCTFGPLVTNCMSDYNGSKTTATQQVYPHRRRKCNRNGHCKASLTVTKSG